MSFLDSVRKCAGDVLSWSLQSMSHHPAIAAIVAGATATYFTQAYQIGYVGTANVMIPEKYFRPNGRIDYETLSRDYPHLMRGIRHYKSHGLRIVFKSGDKECAGAQIWLDVTPGKYKALLTGMGAAAGFLLYGACRVAASAFARFV